MTIIGIDPGSQLAAACTSDGKLLGCWQLRGHAGETDLAHRLQRLSWELLLLWTELDPAQTIVAIERPAGNFRGNGWLVATAYGVALSACASAARVIDIAPTEAKLALTGRGNADKQEMILFAAGFCVAAEPYYWMKQGKTSKQALDLAATVADAFGVAIAAGAKMKEAEHGVH